MTTTAETPDDQQEEQRPGPRRQTENRTADTGHQKEAATMPNATPVPSGFEPSGLSTADLEALASAADIRIQTRDEIERNRWSEYNPDNQTITLRSQLAPVQLRCVLAHMIAHIHLRGLSGGTVED